MSPKKEKIIIKEIKKYKLKLISILYMSVNVVLINIEATKPPIKPSIVLFGLIFVNLFLPKDFPIR